MFLVFQFPLSDARCFVPAGTNRLPVPQWPLANAGSEFVRSFGQVQRRKRGGIEGWAGEELYCTANRALRFDPPLGRQTLGIEGDGARPLCLFRRFFSDGGVVSRLEVGFRPNFGVLWSLTGDECLQLVESCYAIKVRVCSCKGTLGDCAIVDAGRILASHYLAASTRRSEGKTLPTEAWWLSSREPLLLIEYEEAEIASVPTFSSQALSLPEAGVVLHHCWVNHRGRLLGVWFLGTTQGTNADIRRRLRIHLLRLHAERECLKEILRLIAQRKIPIVPKTQACDDLQSYLLESTRLISRQTYYGFEQSKLLEELQRFDDIVNPGDRPTLLTQISKIRRNIVTNIAELTKPGEDAAGSVHVVGSTVIIGNVEKVGGETVTSYNVTISGSNNTVGDIIVAEKIQNSFNKVESSKVGDDLRKNLAMLHQQVVDLTKQLPTDKARQVASDLEVFTNEVTSPSPRRKWYELSADGLIEAAKTVATIAGPVTTTVKAILSVLSLAATA